MRLKHLAKRGLALLLCGSMLACVFTGCGNTENDDEQIQETVLYSAAIDGTFATEQTNPSLTITLTNTEAGKNLTADMFTLDGAFSHLIVTNVSGSGSNIHLSTEGTVVPNSSCSGIVKLSEAASEAATELRAEAPVEIRTAYIDETSYQFSSSAMTFDIVLANDTFKDYAPKITVADYTAAVVSVSDDKTRAAVSVTLAGASTDEKAANVNGKELTVSADSVSSGNAYTMSIALAQTAVNAYVDYISSEGSIHTADVYLYIRNGKANLSKNDIALYGDFANAAVSSLEKVTDGQYKATITFTAALSGEYELNGELSVAAGKLTNVWGSTNTDAVYCGLHYTNAADRGETIDAILQFVADHKDTLDKISTVGSAVSGVAGVFSGVQTILQVCGVLETTDDKLEKINRQMEMMNATMSELNDKMGNLSSQMTNQIVTVNEQNYQTLATASQAAWTAFTTDHLNQLNSVLNQYNSAYYNALLQYVYDAEEYEIIIYRTADGGVTLPNPNSKDKSIDIEGAKITETETIVLGFELTNVEEKLAANQGRVYPEIMHDIELALCDMYDAEYLEEVLGALSMDLSYKAVQSVGAQKIVDTFVNCCYGLAGSTGGVKPSAAVITPIDNYIQLLSCFYNFESEAKTDIQTMQTYLLSILLKGKSLATLAEGYAPNLTYDTVNSYKWAVDEVNSACDMHDLSGYAPSAKIPEIRRPKDAGSYDQYCYVTASKIKYRNLVIASSKFGNFTAWNYSADEQLTNESQLMIMQNRWNRLHKTNATTHSTFESYMKANFSKDMRTQFLTKHFEEKGYSADNSINLKCVGESGDYFSVGTKYNIGSSGDIEEKYFSRLKKIVGTHYNISNQKISDFIAAHAVYTESHWYWRTSEDAYFVSEGYTWADKRNVNYAYSGLLIG